VAEASTDSRLVSESVVVEEEPMEAYPKIVRLKDGSRATLRPMVREDVQKLLAFFRKLPEEDRLFLKEDVTDQKVIQQWVDELDYDKVFPILAEVQDEIVADATLHTLTRGWSRHIGEVRCVVAKEYQRKGLGTILIREMFHRALQKGLYKLQASMPDKQVGAMKAFRTIGFKKEAVLKEHAMDIKGNKHDLVIMTNLVEELWRKIGDHIMETGFSAEH
jgi:RimJ/RimL family protein N-acetyltransferase